MYYAWGHTPVILALRKQRQEDSEFGTNLGYISPRYALGTQQDYILKQKNKTGMTNQRIKACAVQA